jgi:hypothetical protein
MATLAVASKPNSRQLHEACVDPAQFRAVVPAEVGDGLVVGSEASRHPHDHNVVAGFAFEPPARLRAVEVAVDVKLRSAAGW